MGPKVGGDANAEEMPIRTTEQWFKIRFKKNNLSFDV